MAIPFLDEVQVVSTTAAAMLSLRSPSGSSAAVWAYSGGSLRWVYGMQGTGDFLIEDENGGSTIDIPFRITHGAAGPIAIGGAGRRTNFSGVVNLSSNAIVLESTNASALGHVGTAGAFFTNSSVDDAAVRAKSGKLHLGVGNGGSASTMQVEATTVAFNASLILADPGLGNNRGIYGTMGGDDFWRVTGRADSTDLGYLEIATADGGNEPIYVRQYSYVGSNPWGNRIRTLTLLDESGNTTIPGVLNVSAGDVNLFAFRKKNGYSAANQSTGGLFADLNYTNPGSPEQYNGLAFHVSSGYTRSSLGVHVDPYTEDMSGGISVRSAGASAAPEVHVFGKTNYRTNFSAYLNTSATTGTATLGTNFLDVIDSATDLLITLPSPTACLWKKLVVKAAGSNGHRIYPASGHTIAWSGMYDTSYKTFMAYPSGISSGQACILLPGVYEFVAVSSTEWMLSSGPKTYTVGV